MAERMSKSDLRDGRSVGKEWDMSLVQIASFEKLLKFIGCLGGNELSVS
jgi:hypothetical protein